MKSGVYVQLMESVTTAIAQQVCPKMRSNKFIFCPPIYKSFGSIPLTKLLINLLRDLA